jgi:hypothetical protein
MIPIILMCLGGTLRTEISVPVSGPPIFTLASIALGSVGGDVNLADVKISDTSAWPSYRAAARSFVRVVGGYADAEAAGYAYVLRYKTYTVYRRTVLGGDSFSTTFTILGIPGVSCARLTIDYSPGQYTFRLAATTKYCQLLMDLFGQPKVDNALDEIVDSLASARADGLDLIDVTIDSVREKIGKRLLEGGLRVRP